MAGATTDAAARARRLLGRGFTLWRRSLLFRVVAGIVLLSAIVVGVAGWLVTRQITDGLVDSRVKQSVSDADSETSVALRQLGDAGVSDFDPDSQIRQLVASLVARGDARGYDVVVEGPVAEASGSQGSAGASATPTSASPLGGSLNVRSSGDLDPVSVPARLRRVVEREPGTSWTFTRIRYAADSDKASRPGVVVGSTIELPSDGSTYAVYYLFDMHDEQSTLTLVRRSLLTSGVLLVVLVAVLAWLVVRQVVDPVRRARRVAERIAAGRLEERLRVTGDDDLARLATSFNQMASTLQQQIRELVELSRVQRTFVSDVSHELRTPLTTVRMAGDVLYDARAGFDPVTARAAELLQTELDRFESLLTDLLEISRFDARAANLELVSVDLVAVATDVVESVRPVAIQHGVQLDVTSAGPCVAEVDVRRVERILRNLVSNAIDHADSGDPTAPAPRVDVTLAADDEAVAVTVRDHGIGLQPGESARVFNRFWRADPARARTTGGTGLGLAISLEDARLHGGWLQAWGAPGEGACFRLTMPRRAGDELRHSPLPLTDHAEAV